MRSAVRDVLAIALLWLACGSIASVAQGVDSGDINNSDKNNPSNDNTTLLITSTSTISTTESRLPATCRSGTVNYITHTLPQQCPTSSWIAPGHASQEGNATTSSVNLSGDGREATSSAHSVSTVLGETAAQSSNGGESAPPLDSPPSNSATNTVTSTAPSPTTTVAPETTATEPEAEMESDSPLDNANFLSFEEWKKQNLDKAGQSPDGGQPSNNHGRTRPDIALDALGDDGEISLDFAGFGSSSRPQEADKRQEQRKSSTDTGSVSTHTPILRNKDAGKTCKERSNYASFDCAATILKTNPEAKSASAILIENKDSYMLNPCSTKNKFIIIELCNDILIDTLVLANYEFFSSIFRTFRVSVSDRYPVKAEKWKQLGVFEASNSRSVQAFLIEQPLIWARYLRIEFLTHFGSEYYCPLSLLRVHGTTMIEEYKHHEQVNRGEHLDDGEDDVDDAENVEGGEDVSRRNEEKPAQEPETLSMEADKSVIEEAVPTIDPQVETAPESVADKSDSTIEQTDDANSTRSSIDTSSTQDAADHIPTSSTQYASAGSQSASNGSASSYSASIPTGRQISSAGSTLLEKASKYLSDASATIIGNPDSTSRSSPNIDLSSVAAAPDAKPNASSTLQDASTRNQSETATRAATTSISQAEPLSETLPERSTPISAAPPAINSTSTSVSSASPRSTVASQQRSQTTQVKHASASSPAPVPQQAPRQQSQHGKPPSSSQSNHHKAPSSSVSAPHANPTTQESFFKSISTRLRALEQNATLSLQYIESQSLLLRTAFAAVEKRQLTKTTNFLSTLNATVTGELEGFKKDYERLWEGVVIELEFQRRGSERELELVLGRLRTVAEELVWQKRVAVGQTFLILLCLGLVMFARSGVGGTGVGLDVPLLQQLQLGRSKWRAQSPDEYSYGDRSPLSPPHSPALQTVEMDFGSPGSDRAPTSEKKRAWPLRHGRGFWRGSVDSNNKERTSRSVSESTDGRPSIRGSESSVVRPASAAESAQGSSNAGSIGSGRRIARGPELRFHSATPTLTPDDTPLRACPRDLGGRGDITDSEAEEEEEEDDEEEEQGDDGDGLSKSMTSSLALDDESLGSAGDLAVDYDDRVPVGDAATSLPSLSSDLGEIYEEDESIGEDEEVELDEEDAEEDKEEEEEEKDLVVPKETQSSPSTPSGTRDMQGITAMMKDIPPWSSMRDDASARLIDER